MKEDTGCCSDDGICLCDTEGILNLISKKWTICIVSLLGERDHGYRFNELKRRLHGISSKSLSDRLKELEKEGLVYRSVKPSVPPAVTYTLTEDGHTLKDSLRPLEKWVNHRE